MSLLVSFRQSEPRSVASLLLGVGVTVLAICLTLVIAACGEHELVGKWQSTSTGEIVEFTSDGRMVDTQGVTTGPEITYETEGNVVVFDFGGVQLRAEYSIDGDSLTLGDPLSGGYDTLTRID